MNEPDTVSIGFGGYDGSMVEFSKNSYKSDIKGLLWLFLCVFWNEISSFYSIYFILIGTLECFGKEIASTNPVSTWVPQGLAIIFEYILQLADEIITIRKRRKEGQIEYNVLRGSNMEEKIKAIDIEPGDIIRVSKRDKDSDFVMVPCDCIPLIELEGDDPTREILVNESKVNGETKPKTKNALNTRKYWGDHSPKGEFHWTRGNKTCGRVEPNLPGKDNAVIVEKNILERGTLILSNDELSLLAIYTGDDCISNANVKRDAGKRTLVDGYVEKLTLFVFAIQFAVMLVIGIVGYTKALAKGDELPYMMKSNDGSIDAWLFRDKGAWRLIIFILRNFLLLSNMVPITLKLLLPVFRLFYGLFISFDLNFVDGSNKGMAEAVSTHITENLGAVDVIVTDKTGTLTRDRRRVVSMAVRRDGDVAMLYKNKDPTVKLCTDENLATDIKAAFNRLQEGNIDWPYMQLMILALTTCHTVKKQKREDQSKGKKHARYQYFSQSPDEEAMVKFINGLGSDFEEGRVSENMWCTVKSDMMDYKLSVRKPDVLKFHPDRKRMTVIAEIEYSDGTRNLYVFTKGAPASVKECLNGTAKIEADNMERLMGDNRTFLFAYKIIEGAAEPLETMHIENNQDEQKYWESDMEVLGAIGLEESLQEDVTLTVDVLTQAGMKIWVATGDADRNSYRLARMCKLIKDEFVVGLQYEKGDKTICTNINAFTNKALEVKENSFSVVIGDKAKDDRWLEKALTGEDDYSPNFIKALLRARCVIFHSCKPETKMTIVEELKNEQRKVLCVGDGANDSAMLRRADVGVGIKGAGGTRAFASCDFAVPAFRNLGRLIVVHGHMALHRSSLVVNFSFYKAVMFAWCQIMYQIWTDCTGQSFFDSISITMYNNVFTLIPLISLLFEKDISENWLYKYSSLHKQLKNPLSISFTNMAWFGSATYQGIITMWIIRWLIGEVFPDYRGRDYGATFASILVYIALVISCTFYMAYQTNTFTYYSMLLIVGNVVLLFAWSAALQSQTDFSDWVGAEAMNGFFKECLNDLGTITVLVTAILASVLPAWLGVTVMNEMANKMTTQIIEKETLAAKADEGLFIDPPNEL